MLEVDRDPSELEELVRLAREAGAGSIAEEGGRFLERVAEGRFTVACVGQFKRGKSTLLNALVGETVLPTGVVPVTAIPTILRHGSRRAARVRFGDCEWQPVDPGRLSAYVAEDENPANEKNVTAVEVFVPSALLARGMCLVDTPGLGSVFTANTAATRALVPHVDAALVVVGADPPISADELRLVEEVAQHVRDLLFVLNKADRLSERERSEAARFAERIVAERLRRPVGRLYQVSATERLSEGCSSRDWDALVGAIDALGRRSGSELVRAAEERGARLVAERLRHELDEAGEALMRPVAESERRVGELRACAREAERSLADLRYLFSAEEDRLRRRFVDRRESFVARAVAGARAELGRLVRAEWSRRPGARRAFYARAQELAREVAGRWIESWRAAEQPHAEEAYRAAAQRFVELANGFLARLGESGDPTLAALPRSVGAEAGFRSRSRFYATDLMRLTRPAPLHWVRRLVFCESRFLRSVEEEATAYLERLIVTNSLRAESDFKDRVLESRRGLEAEIRSSLSEIHRSAERALERARERQAAGSDAVAAELERIEALRERLARLRGSRQGMDSSRETSRA